jgi:hypothetical protein
MNDGGHLERHLGLPDPQREWLANGNYTRLVHTAAAAAIITINMHFFLTSNKGVLQLARPWGNKPKPCSTLCSPAVLSGVTNAARLPAACTAVAAAAEFLPGKILQESTPQA